MAERVELVQVIGQLREELTAVMRDGEGADLRFGLGPVELELTVAVSLATGSWIDVASSLAYFDPPAVSALADELQVRWKLNGPAGPHEDGQS